MIGKLLIVKLIGLINKFCNLFWWKYWIFVCVKLFVEVVIVNNVLLIFILNFFVWYFVFDRFKRIVNNKLFIFVVIFRILIGFFLFVYSCLIRKINKKLILLGVSWWFVCRCFVWLFFNKSNWDNLCYFFGLKESFFNFL